MAVYVTCFDVTGRTRDELTALRERAKVRAGVPMDDDQRHAARLLLHAFASFVEARVAVPKDIRMVIADLVRRGDGFADRDMDDQDQEVSRMAA